MPIAQGIKIGSFGLTEPDSGSDARALRTKAVLKGDEWVLNGTKQFVTNIGLENASMVLVAARTGNNKKGNIISAFIVPKNAPGFQLGKKYEKMSWHGSATHEVILEDCHIPKENLLGDPNRGFAQHLAVLVTGRISIVAVSVGVAQACLDESLRYAQEECNLAKRYLIFRLFNSNWLIWLCPLIWLETSILKPHGSKTRNASIFLKRP